MICDNIDVLAVITVLSKNPLINVHNQARSRGTYVTVNYDMVVVS